MINLSTANRRSLDVYITISDSTALPSAPATGGIGTGAVSRYVTSSDSQHDIVVTSTNSTERLVTLARQIFDSKGVYTVLVADAVGGKLPLRVVVVKDSR